jgi:hypothetical protein
MPAGTVTGGLLQPSNNNAAASAAMHAASRP